MRAPQNSALPHAAPAVRLAPRARTVSRRTATARLAYGLVLPSLALIGVLELYPILYSMWLTAQDVNLDIGGIGTEYIGLGNWTQMLHDATLPFIVWTTVSFTGLVVLASLLIGLAIALLLNQDFHGRGFCRLVLLVPWAIPAVVSGRIWGLIFNAGFGILNTLLRALGLVETPIQWLTDPRLAINAVAFAQIWTNVPLVALFLLAALQTIPQELYQAARVDGASAWGCFWHVTLPSIRTVGLILVVLTTISSFKVFDLIYILTNGYADTMVWYFNVFIQSFKNLNFGYGATLAYALFLVILGLTVLYFRLFPLRLEHER
ncbi:MAG: sugar ABC transporter permease [Candidatus Rokubacteria bacterium]|nr:sugar ABC transporter permease [Candidatus Rokubacteria bacterium]